jgi:hypothetical protein
MVCRWPTSPAPGATTTGLWKTPLNVSAAAATEIMAIKRYAHLVGGCRMSTTRDQLKA